MSKSFYRNAFVLAAAAILLIGVSGRFASGQCTSAPSGMSAWWTGDGSGEDLAGTNYGTLMNGTAFGTGKVGQAFEFDGVNDYLKVAAVDNSLKPTEAITLDAWIFPRDINTDQHIISTAGAGPSPFGHDYYIRLTGNSIEFRINDDPLSAGGVIPTANQWYHVAATYDRSTGTRKLYINGTLVNSNGYSAAINTGHTFVTVGVNARTAAFGESFASFNGLIDEVDIIGRALSAAEIQSIFNAGSAGKCKPVCVPPPSSMTSWWPGDNSPNDIRGPVFANGLLAGNAAYSTGIVGQAFSFDGNGDFLGVGDSPDIQFPTGGFSINMWFRTGSLSNSQMLLSKGISDENEEYSINLTEDKSIYWDYGGLHAFVTTVPLPIAADKWHNLTVIYDPDLSVKGKVYLDGVQRDIAVGETGSHIPTIGSHMYIGSQNAGAPYYTGRVSFNGRIDEVAMFAGVLSDAEIRAIYNAGSAGSCRDCSPIPPNAINWWAGDGNTFDLVSGSSGTAQGGTGYGTGVVRRAFSFDGTDDHVIISMPNIDLAAGARNTVEFWMYWRGDDLGPGGDGRMPFGFGTQYDLYLMQGSFGFNTGVSDIWGISSAGLANRWVHVAAVFTNGDARTNKLYIDGVEQTLTQRLGSTGSKTVTQNGRISGWDYPSSQIYSFDGSIDELKVFKGELSAADVRSTFAARSGGTCIVCSAPPTPGLVGWWTGNGHANDVIGVSHGELTNGMSYAPGLVGQAFKLDGANQYALIGDPVPASLQIQNEITLSAWIFATEYPGSDNLGLGLIIGSQYDVTGSGATIFLDGRTSPDGQPSPPGHIHFQIGDGTWHTSNANSQVPLNQWVHIAATRKANEAAKIYYNGVQQPSASLPWSGSISYNGAWFTIGQQKDLNRPFKGLIDEAQIYNVALTSDQILAIVSAGPAGNCAPVYPQPKPQFDFDGDLKADVSVFRPSGGEWWILKSGGGSFATQFGAATDKVVPADFTGDGKTDIAYWRPSGGFWYVLRSEDFTYYAFPFGGTGDIPAPADYDGDGKADAAVFRPTNTTWYMSWSTGPIRIRQFGLAGDMPVPGDYDGDRLADLAVFRPGGSNGAEWWISQSSGGVFATQFGQPSNKAVAADFTGDKRTDIAVWDQASGFWYVLRSDDLSYYAFPFGAAGDMPIAGDFDGDGKADPGVFRPASANWYVNRSTAGILIQQFGQTGDIPLENTFVR